MTYAPQNPCIVQGDRTILVEVNNPLYEEVRDHLARFAELVKSPEHIHTYRITPLSLWNGAASGMAGIQVVSALEKYSKYEVPDHIKRDILEYISRYGRLKLIEEGGRYFLESDHHLIEEIYNHREIQPFLLERGDNGSVEIGLEYRGVVKQKLIHLGFPVEDLAGYTEGNPLSVNLSPLTLGGDLFELRKYQRESVDIFYASGGVQGGNGVIVLPCGAGKTVVGMGVMEKLECETLILVTNVTALRQWKSEILDKTCLKEGDIGEFSGEKKEIRPVTLATYQILTYRKRATEEFIHFSLFDSRNWGLIIYDEVHLLPAPIFRATAQIQSKRRLGLTATLVREDGLEGDVFSLIGPKKYDVPWKVLEKQGWIAEARCCEIRLDLPVELRMKYATTSHRGKFRVASENPGKIPLVKKLLQKHQDESILVIGQYLDQLQELANELKAPIITGKTANAQRQELYEGFKKGEIPLLIVSKVANFAIDLPDASVAIQVSGTFGSRQEEAQRLGRILRPKKDGRLAWFYSLVTRAGNRTSQLTDSSS